MFTSPDKRKEYNCSNELLAHRSWFMIRFVISNEG